jgi:hypothetical protein
MDFLLDCDEAIQREVVFSVANLLNLESTSGSSTPPRPTSRPTTMTTSVAAATPRTMQGIPVRCWAFPGNESAQLITREVHHDLRECSKSRRTGSA